MSDLTSGPQLASGAVEPSQEEVAKQKMIVQVDPVEARPDGTLVPGTLESQYRLAKYYHASKLMPEALCTPEKILVAMQLLFELNLKPMTNIGKVAIINGVPCIFGDLPLALVQGSGQLEDIEEYLVDKDGNRVPPICADGDYFGAYCLVRRKNRASPTMRAFTIGDANTAKLWGKTGSSGRATPWVTYPKRMLQMRARSWALKDAFPDIIGGIPILEYDFNGTVDDRGRIMTGDIQDVKDVSAELNERFLVKNEEASGPSNAR